MVKPDSNTPVLEWIAAALGAVALAAVLGVIVYGLATQKAEVPPLFSFEMLSVTRANDRWHAGFRVTNSGDRPASGVRIVGQSMSSPESAEVILRYVPARSSREGGLYFDSEPRIDGLRFHVDGYEVP